MKLRKLRTAVGLIFLVATGLQAQVLTSQGLAGMAQWRHMQQSLQNPQLPLVLAGSDTSTLQTLQQVWYNGAWVDQMRTTAYYNSQGVRTHAITEKREPGKDWQNNSKDTYRFDSHQNLVEFAMYKWNENKWDPSIKIKNTFNTNKQITESEIWQGQNGLWVRLMKMTITYDNSGNEKQMLQQMWMNNVWTDLMRFSYRFDAQNLLVEELQEMWMVTNWAKMEKTTHHYDSNQNRTEELVQTWAGTAWQNKSRTTYEYDGSNRETVRTEMEWNANAWQNTNKNMTSYNGDGTEKDETAQVWQGSAWVNTIYTTYEYNDQKRPTVVTTQVWDGSQWENASRTLDMYGNPTSVELSGKSALPGDFVLSNYPNPFNPETQILFELPRRESVRVAIYDANGRLIRILIAGTSLGPGLHRVVWDGKDARLQNAASGVYIYRLQAGGRILSGKCTLLR